MNCFMKQMDLSIFLIFCLSTVVSGELLDMTYRFKTNYTIYWPGSEEFSLVNTFRGIYKAPNDNTFWYEGEELAASSHGGTHMDAPSHMSNDKQGRQTHWTVDEIPAANLMGPLRIINVKTKAASDPNYQVTVSDITMHERTHGRIPRGAIVIMNSGWGARWPNQTLYMGEGYQENPPALSFPGFSKEAAQWLSTLREIHGVGVDTASIDHGPSPDWPAHRIFFDKNIYGLENVAHVDKVPETGAIVFAFPYKIATGSGGPCRVVAVWGDSRAMLGAGLRPQFSVLSSFLLMLITFVLVLH